MLINVKVKPNSTQEKIVEVDKNNYEVWLKEKPIDNKANMKLLKLLSKHFGKEVKIKTGLISRKKIVEIF